jgi:hypothetical protein
MTSSCHTAICHVRTCSRSAAAHAAVARANPSGLLCVCACLFSEPTRPLVRIQCCWFALLCVILRACFVLFCRTYVAPAEVHAVHGSIC